METVICIFHLENQQFVTPGTHTELDCEGRPCIKCGKCRDWYFTGDEKTWKWVRSHKNWTIKDRKRWNNDNCVWKHFKHRDGATCGGAVFFQQLNQERINRANDDFAQQSPRGEEFLGLNDYIIRLGIRLTVALADALRSSGLFTVAFPHFCLCEDNNVVSLIAMNKF
ncbi:unnamed protein product [Adineta steineri]|uniref:Uncharacterized protein n=1 Tax=Adineta steineri TaxID=433720 RepID=A0A815FM09_9BILA|nr:unnamed protein product [Adineta steineri]CAF4026044.1 unnamed protein product [Adineta steineri]